MYKKFGPKYARKLNRKHDGYGDTFFIDGVLIKIDPVQHYLWQPVDQDGEGVYVFLQKHRDGVAVKLSLKDYRGNIKTNPGRW